MTSGLMDLPANVEQAGDNGGTPGISVEKMVELSQGDDIKPFLQAMESEGLTDGFYNGV